MSDMNNIVLGNYIDTITDYHANGSYKILKENITLKKEDDYSIMIRTLNFERGDFKNDLIFLNQKEYEYLKKTKVYPGDIIMNKIANPGSVYLMPDLNKPVSLAMNLFLIRLNSKLNQKYMYYLMKIHESYIKRFANGTTTLTITKESVRDLKFKVPSIKIQNTIEEFLSRIDKKIELNKIINAELESLAKLIYDYWFVQFDFPDKNGKPYKSSGGKMVWNEELKREIPEGWEVSELGKYYKLQRGISYKGSEINGSGIPMINLNSFYLNGTYKREGIKIYSGKYSEKNLTDPGDLLIATTDVTRNADIIGRAIIVPDYYKDNIVYSMDIAKISPKKHMTASYLVMLFNSNHYHNYIKWFASGTLVLHLNTDGTKWYKAEIPPKSLLDKYDDFYSSICMKINRNSTENTKLEKLRDWLLPMLMNGQVSVSNIEE